MRIAVRVLDRRAVLKGGLASLGALAACDRLVLPDQDLPDGEIPPITPNGSFYVTSIANPDVDAATWAVDVVDRGETLGTIDLALLESLTPRDTERTLQCIGSSATNQAIGNAVWAGLPLPEILAELGVTLRSDALEIVMEGADGYSTALPRADVDRPMWLVWRMNGEPLPRPHGFPARLLAPGRYGTKNVKWLTRLFLVDEPYLGYWETRGWSNDATYLANTFVHAPPSRASFAGGARLVGSAFAGEDEIVAVDVSADGGATFEAATITYQSGPGVWTLWEFDFAAEPGEYELVVRCTTASGATSNDDGGASLAGYDASMRIELLIT